MRSRSNKPAWRGATSLLALAYLGGAAVLAASPSGAAAAPRLHAAADMERVTQYWTPARMRNARPLDRSSAPVSPQLLGRPSLTRAGGGTATASYAGVADPTVQPYRVIGRLFVKQGLLDGYCSGTAINSPTRQLVLTAGHCVNSGPIDATRRGQWSKLLEFVPAYNDGVAPFGVFVARRSTIRAPMQWIRRGNPNFDMGAFLTRPNANGQNVADAVGGGATIVLDQERNQQFQTFGYPGSGGQMQQCDSPYTGDDAITYSFGGPPTMAVSCRWRPGASGGGWLIDNGAEIDGLTSYNLRNDKKHTFSPYFGSGNLGALVAGL